MSLNLKPTEDKIRFDDQVAIVTGGGGGLGRVYALELAARGARVVVNDYGKAPDGKNTDDMTAPAQKVVNEIKKAGGKAVANYDNVASLEGGQNIVDTALKTFGTLDIIINNAGIIRDKSFAKMDVDHWNSVMDVHVAGAYNVTGPGFKIMKEKGYGRIIMTTSAAGLYGNFGQTNYSCAKLGLVGFMNSLKLEGEKYNIKVNSVAPMAASAMTKGIMPDEIFEKCRPEYVMPLILYLCSDQCPVTGNIYNAGMGVFNRAAIFTGQSLQIGTMENPPTPEMIHENFAKINDMTNAKEIRDATSAVFDLLAPPEGQNL